jgi:hypothetical protein
MLSIFRGWLWEWIQWKDLSSISVVGKGRHVSLAISFNCAMDSLSSSGSSLRLRVFLLFIALPVYFVLQVVPCLRLLLALTIKLNENPLRLLIYRDDIHLLTLRTPLLHFGP